MFNTMREIAEELKRRENKKESNGKKVVEKKKSKKMKRTDLLNEIIDGI